MKKSFAKKPLALALGAAFTMGGATAQAGLFQVAELGSGYMVAQATPANPAKAGKASEAMCGAACIKDLKAKGKSDADAKAHCDKMAKEGKCGEGKCGGDKTAHEGKCGEGKCGEGKCGGKK